MEISVRADLKADVQNTSKCPCFHANYITIVLCFSPKTHTRTNTYGQVFVLKCCSSTEREYFRRIGSFVLNYIKDVFGVVSCTNWQTAIERTFTLYRIRRFVLVCHADQASVFWELGDIRVNFCHNYHDEQQVPTFPCVLDGAMYLQNYIWPKICGTVKN